MKSIQDSRVSFNDGKWVAACSCEKVSVFASKSTALNMVHRGSCRHCKRDYRSVKDADTGIYAREDGKWCSLCSGCGKEQAYTRKDHAKQSSTSDWQCKSCIALARGYSENRPVGDFKRLINQFYKSATNRGIDWTVSDDEIISIYNGKCALSGWDLSISYANTSASLDRIDSNKPYAIDNIQWVHKMVNMSKNKYDQDVFVKMCKAIAANLLD